jgi:N-acetylglucosaminyldiphosphoundecaprenol N-acetyl-beta-D-mannosaminyltransferase
MNNMTTDFYRSVYCILGLPFDSVKIGDAVRIVHRASLSRYRCFFSTPNLNFLISCQNDTSFRNSVIHGDLSLADGMPIIWLARMLNIPLAERVAGSSLFERLRNDKNYPINVYFFGGPPGVAESACNNLNVEYASMRCVGFDSPGYGSIEEMSSVEIIDRINRSSADFLVVALGAKKGNSWIEHNLDKLNVPVVSHLGAVVNFVAGSVSRAPVWMQRTGLEWLWRIKEEPTLWLRYLKDGFAFIKLLITCVLPYAWHLQGRRTECFDLNLPDVQLVASEGKVSVVLKGLFVQDGLSTLRAALTQVTKTEVDVCVDLAGVSYVDSAFIGTLLLLYGHQQRIGRKFSIYSPQQQVLKVFRWCRTEFLLSGYDD